MCSLDCELTAYEKCKNERQGWLVLRQSRPSRYESARRLNRSSGQENKTDRAMTS